MGDRSEAHPVNCDLRVEVVGGRLPSESSQAAVDRLWAGRPAHLFDGPTYALLSYSESRIEVARYSYRLFWAGWQDRALREEVGLLPIGVRGVVRWQGRIAIGRRPKWAGLSPGQLEFAPAGSIDDDYLVEGGIACPQKVLAVPSGCGGHLDRSAPHPGASTLGSSRSSRPGSPCRGSHLPALSEGIRWIDYRGQILHELEEEVGATSQRVTALSPFLLVTSERVADLVLAIELDGPPEREGREYEELFWVEEGEILDFVERYQGEMVDRSLQIAQAWHTLAR